MTKDLSPFINDNVNWRSRNKRVPWEERIELINKHFPATQDPDYNIILRDNDVFGRILRDILKVDQIEPGRAGPRPNLDYERGMQSWKEMTGQDYCEMPFVKAFKMLTRDNSYLVVARKTRISRSRVHRLANGQEPPTIDDLRDIAGAYNKKPAYFAEYRAEFIMAAIATRLADEAEMTTAIYTKLVRQ